MKLSVSPHHAWWGSEWASEPGHWLWLSGPTGRQCLNLEEKWLLNTLHTIPKSIQSFNDDAHQGLRTKSCKGEGTGRFKLERNLREVVGTVFNSLDSPPSSLYVAKARDSSHYSHFKYTSNSYASQDRHNPESSSWPCLPLNQISSLSFFYDSLRCHVFPHPAFFHAFQTYLHFV